MFCDWQDENNIASFRFDNSHASFRACCGLDVYIMGCNIPVLLTLPFSIIPQDGILDGHYCTHFNLGLGEFLVISEFHQKHKKTQFFFSFNVQRPVVSSNMRTLATPDVTWTRAKDGEAWVCLTAYIYKTGMSMSIWKKKTQNINAQRIFVNFSKPYCRYQQ